MQTREIAELTKMVAQQNSSGLEVPLYLVINIEGKGKVSEQVNLSVSILEKPKSHTKRKRIYFKAGKNKLW